MKNMLGDIFKDIISGCNKLISATLSRNENPKDAACNRLRLVLMHDRTKLDPATLERMRDELVEVISRYVEIDQELLDLNLASEGNAIALVASIPVIRAKQIPDTESNSEEKDISFEDKKLNLYDDDFDEDDIETVIIEEDLLDDDFDTDEEDLSEEISEDGDAEEGAENSDQPEEADISDEENTSDIETSAKTAKNKRTSKKTVQEEK